MAFKYHQNTKKSRAAVYRISFIYQSEAVHLESKVEICKVGVGRLHKLLNMQ